jgi:hypothetical protein
LFDDAKDLFTNIYATLSKRCHARGIQVQQAYPDQDFSSMIVGVLYSRSAAWGTAPWGSMTR